MRKIVKIIVLALVIMACGSQKTPPPLPKNVTSTTETAQKTPENSDKQNSDKIIKYGNLEFFAENIADISKNDNTISYGSIVSAKPENYKINKDYFPSLGQNFRIRYLVLHYTALDVDASIRALTRPGVSAHYLVSDIPDDEIYQLVDENKRAYHSGVSSWRKDAQLNDNSIGIEIVNKGYAVDSANNKKFYPYPEYQFRKVAALAKDIATRYNIPPTNILAHSDIAPARKQDPGPLFPWKRLYDEYQIGMWYDESVKQNLLNQILSTDFETLKLDPSYIYKIQSDFKTLGYGIELSATWDAPTKKVIEAFQYHFPPSYCDGILDPETYAILQALNQKYK